MAERKKKYYQRPDGLFESIRTINGKRVAFRGKTCKEVDRKILEYQAEAAKGRKFPVIADEWAREHEPKISESTRRVYSFSVRRLKEAFPGYASDVRPLEVQRYITNFEKQGRAANSVQIELSVCKMIFSHAVMQGDIDVSPAAEVRKSRGLPTKKRLALTEEQEAAVKEAGVARTAHWWLFPYLLLYTGMRRGEALALSYSDIDRKAGVIHVTKKLSYAANAQRPQMETHLKSKNGERDIPLLRPLADALPRNHVGLIFPGDDGGFMRSSEITKNWKRYCRDVGLNEMVYDDAGKVVETFPITPHCFRHSFATICYEAGLDPRQAAEILGDTPEVLEGVYTHLRAGQRRTAAEMLAAHIDATAMC